MTTTAHEYEGRVIKTNSWFETICLCGSFAEVTDEPGLRTCYHHGERHEWRYDMTKQAFVFVRAVLW